MTIKKFNKEHSNKSDSSPDDAIIGETQVPDISMETLSQLEPETEPVNDDSRKPRILVLAPQGTKLTDGRLHVIENNLETSLLDRLIEALQYEFPVLLCSVSDLKILKYADDQLWSASAIKSLEDAPSGVYTTHFFMYARQFDSIMPDELLELADEHLADSNREHSSYDVTFANLKQAAAFQDMTARFGNSLDGEEDGLAST